MTSPCNTIGCSYAPPDEEPYFHQVWINAYPTCCVRDTFQTQMRVRHLKNNVMKFCLPDKKAMQFCKARYELKFDLEHEETPLELKRIYFFNLFEQTISTMFYDEMFYIFLDKCGYKRQGVMFPKTEENELPKLDQSNKFEIFKILLVRFNQI